ncbi:MAG: phenylalanine--tRNA ligase subunit alpha [Leptolyngbya sp. PLA3]|nr:MAG: phenylalanine--tRNA ligase subunit alpha [Cyanobacteria bacterium CYA]MCE7969109.1 phenylalanine--tRNA ligase subunit alpha [Leptolyngbya sp. PL-A3]
MLDVLEAIRTEGLAQLASAADAASLERWRVAFLGTKGRLKGAMGGMKDLSPAEKPKVGALANAVKSDLEQAFEARRAALSGGGGASSSEPRVDMTEPGLVSTQALGRRHIISRVRDELVDVFGRMGFDVAQGPELEDDEHNFVKLNIPQGHPAREPIDNFYVDDPLTAPRPRMLRSQTSTVQIRTMEDAVQRRWGPPIRVVSPGRVYRPDTVDATHSFMFHQIEGLYLDRGVSMVDLKSTLMHFARAYFSEDAQVRLRPSFFPFTEPSAEFDMMIALKPGEPARWIELGGCGMVDPNVLEACGIDPEVWTGFAFGFGIERIAMGKYGIPDIRMLFENDLRFLEQV